VSPRSDPVGDDDRGETVKGTAGQRQSGEGNRYRIEALARGLAVLRSFNESTTSSTLSEISERTGIPLATVFRIVATLEAEGYLEKLPEGRIRPAVQVLLLGSAALRASGLVELSAGPLRRLGEQTGETVNLGVLTGDQVLYLARVRKAELVTANLYVGSTLPAAYTSMGKMLLAWLAHSELEAVLKQHDFGVEYGPNAVRSLDELRERLAEIRIQGYALQDQEVAAGLRSVAVPVFGDDPAKPIAAINIAVASARYQLETLRGPFLETLRATALEISQLLR
jgi:IclR family pca regulon transcriptional regulator